MLCLHANRTEVFLSDAMEDHLAECGLKSDFVTHVFDCNATVVSRQVTIKMTLNGTRTIIFRISIMGKGWFYWHYIETESETFMIETISSSGEHHFACHYQNLMEEVEVVFIKRLVFSR